MRAILQIALGAVLALLVGGSASGQQPEVFSALLAEIRHIRVVIDRATTVNPRIQIALHRLDNQQERVSRLSMQLEGTRSSLQRITNALNLNFKDLTGVEEALQREADQQKRRALDEERRPIKAAIERQTEEQQTWQRREAELTSQLDAEQLRWNELNAQLDALMRSLEQR